MAYADQAALAEDATFRGKVRVAMATAATAVMGEAKGVMSDTKFGKRQALAYSLITGAFAGSWLDAFAWGVVANPVITGASSDNDIQFTVNSLVDDLAGVRITD